MCLTLWTSDLSYPIRVEGQTADSSNSLSHETIIVFNVADNIPIGVIHSYKLIHRTTDEQKQRGRQFIIVLPYFSF